MIFKTSFLISCTLFVFTEAAFVDNLPAKCSIRDWDCTKNLLQTVLRDIAKSGVPDFDIPPTDPYVVKNVTVSVLDMGSITMIDGVAKGIKNCVVEKFEVEVDKENAVMELLCDLTIKGKYKAEGHSPLLQTLLGGTEIKAEGVGKVVLQKLHMVFNYRFYVRERNGDTFIESQLKDLKYSHDIGKAIFAGNGIKLGGNDASDVIVPLLNQNWKLIMQTIGKTFIDKAMDIVYEHSLKFFERTPTKYYLIDDLTPYIKSD